MKPISETDLEQLSAYIDGELSDSERRFFQKRLANDAELRAACERAWIASSVLKSQPMRLMPAGSADAICAQCQPEAGGTKAPWRLVASFAALALVAGLGYQLMPAPDVTAPDDRMLAQQTSVPPPSASPSGAEAAPAAVQKAGAKPAARPAAKSDPPSTQLAAADDPTRFELNEATRSKSWPKSDQALDGYLARHNQMTGSNTGNDLISYAQMLSAPQTGAEDGGKDGQ
ncbi:sigma-E factor negative regulatory protein [Arenimonas sp. GDDSR-1]|uniref:sigma-E factor negative regulatory protein n=1 Tax=Arenimonas sp. GDDSR-1 TaxID=2950125 RepID=UPI0026328032|nr:sigma-E factor negative regulatory protein [Arenimonas sp. GDDSR-1]